MARILFITPYYPPDFGPSAPLVSSLCERLVSEKHAVSVIAAVPHYPSGMVSPEYRRKLWHRSMMNGVEVWQVWVPSGKRNSFLHRVLVFGIYQILATLVGIRLTYDTAVITNPAIETGLPFAVLCWLRRKPAIFCVWDLYPEIGVELGIFHDPLTIRIVKVLEDFCLQRAAVVQALAESFLPRLGQRVRHITSLVYIPPWTDIENLQPAVRNNRFSSEHGLDNDFVVLYAGNLGFSQNLESIVLVARELKAEKHLRFVFVGDGRAKETLQLQASTLMLENVIFLPYQPRDRLAEVLSTADLAIVSIRVGAANHSIPSKTFALMACGRPILASVEKGCDLYDLIQQTRSGICVHPDDINTLVATITSLKSNTNQRTVLGRNGRAFVEEQCSAGIAAKQFEKLILKISKQAVC